MRLELTPESQGVFCHSVLIQKTEFSVKFGETVRKKKSVCVVFQWLAPVESLKKVFFVLLLNENNECSLC